MGNLNIKGYTPTSKDPIEGGVNNIWKIYQASKKSLEKDGSIFCFEKKKYANFNLDKDKKEANFEILKKEASNLSRYMHPNVLKILEPFHEDSHVIAFVTEPVECTLAQILHQKREIPIRSDLTELKIILMELLEGISYLNEKTNSAHLSLCPENIYVTTDGKWKIGGFGFLCQSEVAGNFKSDKISLGDGGKGMINPNPAFCPLELLENGKDPSPKSDIFSLVMILYSIFKLKGDNYQSPFYIEAKQQQDVGHARQKFRDLDNSFQKKEFAKIFPAELKTLAERAVSSVPSQRPSLNEFKLNPWFNDNMLRGLLNLGEFYKLETPKQKIYLKAFAKIVPKYSSRICHERILPFLTEQLLNTNVMHEVVTILLYILQKKCIASDSERKEAIWPIFQKLFNSKKISGQVLYLTITYIELICTMLTKEEIQNNIVGLFFKCFDCKVPQIQILTISRTEGLAKLIDFSEIKNKLLPRILLLCDDEDQTVKRCALRFIYGKLSVCDSSLAENGLLKMVERNLVSGNSPQTNMILLDILKEIGGTFSTDVIASKVLPIMIPFLVNPSSTKYEFTKFFDTISIFLQEIQKKRMIDLNNQQNSANITMQEDEELKFIPLESLVMEAKVEGEGFDFLFGTGQGKTQETIQSAFSGGFSFGGNIAAQSQEIPASRNDNNLGYSSQQSNVNISPAPQHAFSSFNLAGQDPLASQEKAKHVFQPPPQKAQTIGSSQDMFGGMKMNSQQTSAPQFDLSSTSHLNMSSHYQQNQQQMTWGQSTFKPKQEEDLFSGMNIKNSGTINQSGGLMDLGLNSFSNVAKPKGNFDVFDSLGNDNSSDLMSGMGGLDLSGKNQSHQTGINNSNFTFGSQANQGYGMANGMNTNQNLNSGYDMFSGMKQVSGTSGMNINNNSGLMDLGFGNMSGGNGLNNGSLQQTGYGQNMTMNSSMNSTSNFGMNNMGMSQGQSDIFKGMNVKPTTQNNSSNFGDFDLLQVIFLNQQL